ncbi:hypothetical protein G4B88_022397 [Cannabis sativa]|uniref:RRM domain-containing protein n=1 Tax=Cannabis sativa TaxID=3483 RepID=A0A7J6HVH1_CANSA|nr:hypothetical protein G4B88_022397 [Cannabis sativa]
MFSLLFVYKSTVFLSFIFCLYENGAAIVDLPTGPNYSASGRKLFVGGVSWSTSKGQFEKYFSQFGEITDSVIILNKHSGNPRGFGFVTFANPTDADKVIEQDHVIDGKKVDVKRTVPKDSMKAPSDKKMIFVGGLSVCLSNDQLEEYFKKYDDIVRTQIIRCPKSGRSRGFGFVTFSSEDAVEKILKEDTVHVLGGKKVELKKFNPESAGNNYSNNAATTKSNEASAAGAGHEGSHYGDQYNGKMEQVYWDHEAYCNFGASYYGNYPGFYGFHGAYLYGPPAYIPYTPMHVYVNGADHCVMHSGYGCCTSGYGCSNMSGNHLGNSSNPNGEFGGSSGSNAGNYRPIRK